MVDATPRARYHARMPTHYNIDPELKALSGFDSPMAPWIPRVAEPLFDLLPKCIDHKHTVFRRHAVPRADGSTLPLLEFAPRSADEPATPLPCLLYLHGGGFMYNAIPTQYKLVQEYALGAGCRVLCPDYRLAPMHPFPAGVQDCTAALAWITANATKLRIDATRIIMAGDSAGGSLVLNTYCAAKVQGAAPLPKAVFLIYPVVDHRARTASMREFTDTPIWNARKNAHMWEYYLQGAAYTSPLEHAADFSTLTCAFVEVEQFDCLHDEGVELARALETVGVATTLRDNVGTYHGFEFHHHAAVTQASVAARIAFLRDAFA